MRKSLALQYAEKLGEWFGVDEIHKRYDIDKNGKIRLTGYGVYFNFFSDDHIDDLLFTTDLKREIESSRKYLQRLEKFKKLVKNDFELVLDGNRKVRYKPELKVGTVINDSFVGFFIENRKKKMKVQICCREGGDLQFQERHIQDFQEVKKAILKLIDVAEVKLKEKVKKYKEKIKFLKQPVVSYDQIFKPVVEKKGISRENLLMKFVEEVHAAVKKINDAQSNMYGDCTYCRVELNKEDSEYLRVLEKSISGVKELKTLVSCVDPHFVKFRLYKDNTVAVANYVRCFYMPKTYFDCLDKKHHTFPFIKKIRESGDGTDLLKYLDELEKFFTRKLQQELEKRHAKNQIKRIQSANRKMML